MQVKFFSSTGRVEGIVECATVQEIRNEWSDTHQTTCMRVYVGNVEKPLSWYLEHQFRRFDMLRLGPWVEREHMPEELYPRYTDPKSLNSIPPVPVVLTFSTGPLQKIEVQGKLYSHAWFDGMNFDGDPVYLYGITGGKDIDISKALLLPFGWENYNNGGGIAFLPDEDWAFEPSFDPQEGNELYPRYIYLVSRTPCK